MKRREEKFLVKFIKKMAKSNPEVNFLYNNSGLVVADCTHLSEKIGTVNLSDLCIPKDYYSLDLLDASGRTALVCDLLTESPVTYLTVDECLKEENAEKYENFKSFQLRESTFGSFVNRVINKAKNGISYFFSKRSDAEEDFSKSSFIKELNNNKLSDEEKLNKFDKDLENLLKQHDENVKKEDKKEEIKEETKEETKEEPKEEIKEEVKKETPKKNDVIKDKEDIILNKYYTLLNKKAYNKLGEYEKMFVDDAKAECLNPTDNEFRMMLNERAVDKEAIYNYFFETEGLNIKKSFEKIYSELGEYERMFVEDALSENLEVNDNEFNMMLSERTVDKSQVISFMKAYKENVNKQKELIKNYSGLVDFEKVNYSEYTINDLRKAVAKNKSMLTGAELEKRKTNSLKKSELIEIMDRIDSKKLEKETINKLGL